MLGNRLIAFNRSVIFWDFGVIFGDLSRKKIYEYDEEKKIPVKIQPREDVKEYNPLAIANTALERILAGQ